MKSKAKGARHSSIEIDGVDKMETELRNLSKGVHVLPHSVAIRELKRDASGKIIDGPVVIESRVKDLFLGGPGMGMSY